MRNNNKHSNSKQNQATFASNSPPTIDFDHSTVQCCCVNTMSGMYGKKETIKVDVKKYPNILCVSHSQAFITAEMERLKKSVSNIFYNKDLTCSYQEMYGMVENLCTVRQDDEIHEDLTTLITEFLNLQALDLICYQGLRFLRKLKEHWLMFCYKSKLLRNIYLYMETSVVRRNRRKLSILQMCMELFENIIISNPTIKARIPYVFELIENERDEQEIDTKLIVDIVEMFSKLGLYLSYFEKQYLVKTEKFYIKYRDILLDGHVTDYFCYVQAKMSEEETRVGLYLKSSTEHKVLNIIYKVLIEDKLDVLLKKIENTDIFDNSDPHDIITIYDLLSVLPKANNELCRIFSTYMMNKGSKLVFEEKNENTLIGNLLEFKERVDEVVSNCFKDNTTYAESVKTCFKKFINQRKYKPAQYLAKFIDNRMRDKQIQEDLLDKIMVLFRYIQGKDVFEAHYKRYLSKRLLLGKSSSQDAEKYMISKLKLECGDCFTSKLEGMFKDMDLSETLSANFKQKHVTNILPIDFTVHVLTSGFWPIFTKSSVTLPDIMLQYQTIFHDFYKAKYSGRSLQWVPSLGSCLLTARLKNGNKEFQVSLFQALVILLFNDNTSLSYKNIQLHLNLDDSELQRTILSLIWGKTKLLVKDPQGKEFGDTDELSINEDFSNKLFRIKINQLQYKETDEEQKITEQEVLHDRHLQIDAALVRLMKQNKTMRHNDLIAKMYSALKFPVNPNDIKKRIEILIERDFISRNPEEPNSYYYVA